MRTAVINGWPDGGGGGAARVALRVHDGCVLSHAEQSGPNDVPVIAFERSAPSAGPAALPQPVASRSSTQSEALATCLLPCRDAGAGTFGHSSCPRGGNPRISVCRGS